MGKRTEIWKQLTPTERFSYAIGRALNETHLGKRLATGYGTAVTQRWLKLMTDQLNYLDGAEHIPRDRSFILAANHRTYFDFFATLAGIWPLWETKPFAYCPVRSTFFYDKRRGTFFNLLISGNAMYPPVFRDKRGPEMNQHMVDTCVKLLKWSPRTLIAIHPEGRRNVSDDPYALLPAKAGIGRIALPARAPVVPMFINGLQTRFGSQLRRRHDSESSQIRIFLGPPTELDDLYARPNDPAAHLECAQRVMADIAKCGERERAFAL